MILKLEILPLFYISQTIKKNWRRLHPIYHRQYLGTSLTEPSSYEINKNKGPYGCNQGNKLILIKGGVIIKVKFSILQNEFLSCRYWWELFLLYVKNFNLNIKLSESRLFPNFIPWHSHIIFEFIFICL